MPMTITTPTLMETTGAILFALAVLHTFPKNEARDALEGLVQLTVERTK